MKKKETTGNQAALRDSCLACIKRIDETLPYTDSGMVLTGLLNHIKETLQNAIKEPPRNCDKYPKFSDAITTLADQRGWHDGKWDSERYCVLAAWLLAQED